MYSSLDTAVTILGQAGNIHKNIRCQIMAFC